MATKPPGKEKFKAPLKGTPKHTSPPSSRVLYLIMALVAVVILVGGYLFYYFQEQQMRQRIEGGLSIVAQLKMEQIAAWRAERLTDADMLVGSPFFAEGVEKYMASPTDTEAKDKVLARLAVIEKAYPYQDILLVDVNGSVLLSLNDSVHRLSDVTLAQLPVAIKEHKAVMVDFHYSLDSNSPYLDVVAPLFPWGQDSPQVIGAVVFCIDPSQYLYPLLQSSPMPSETAETLLVERDGDQVLFLSELRHQKDAALKLRIPLSQQENPAVMAVLGKEGVVKGKDYRGAEVLAVLKHIPDSPWYMVAKIDTSEALSAGRSRSGFIIASVVGLLAAALAVTGLIWQRRQSLAYQALYQAELETQTLRSHFEYLVKYANDIIYLTDENYHIVEVNDRALETYGYTRQEMLGMPLAALIPPGDLPSYQARLRKIQQKGTIVAEGIHQRKDGSTFLVEVSGRTIKIEDKTYLQGIVRDITERKRAEKALEHLNLTLRTIRNVNQLITQEKDRQRLLEGICRCLTESRGYQGAWVALLDESSKLVVHAQAGFSGSLLPVVEQLKQGILPRCGQQAMRQPEVVVISEDCSTCGGCALSGEPDGKAALTVRLERGDKVYGLLSAIILPDFMTAEEIGLFQELAGDCAFALYDIDLQDKHKAAEEALSRSEQNFRDSIENSPLGIRIVTADGETIYANRALLDIYGYSSIEELKAVPTRERYTPESYAQHKERKEKRSRGEFVPGSYEISIVRQDGDIRNLTVSRGEVQWNGKRQFQVAYQDITERKQAEEHVRVANERLEHLMSSSSAVIYSAEAHGNYAATLISSNVAQLTGYESREFIEDPGFWYDHIHPDDQQIVATEVPKLFEKDFHSYEYRFQRKDGEYIWIRDEMKLVRDEKGNPIEIVGVWFDITERKLSEESLKESEQRLKEAQTLGKIGNWEYDVDSQTIIWSDEAYVLYERDPALGPPNAEEEAKYYSADQARTLRDYAARSIENGEEFRYDLEAILPSGKRAVFAASMGPIINESGRVIKLFGTVQDVTERKQAEESLRRSEQNFRDSMENSPLGIRIVTADGETIYANRALLDICGYSNVEELKAVPTKQRYTPESYAEHQERKEKRRRGEFVPANYEVSIVRQDGEVRHLAVSRGEVQWNDKRQFEVAYQDITERRKAKETIKRQLSEITSYYDNAPIGLAILDTELRFLRINNALAEINGIPAAEHIGKTVKDIVPALESQAREVTSEIIKTGKVVTNIEFAGETEAQPGVERTWLEGWHPLKDDNKKIIGFTVMVQEITERKQAEKRQELSLKIFATLNKQGEQSELIREILKLIKEFSGCEAMGVRLQKGDDFPYYQTNGFIPGHVEVENRLCAVDQKGEIIRDATGNPVLECMCGNIICSRFDPTKPFFTKGGSFWTNCTTELLASTTEEDRLARTRNRCNVEGYESVALIPLKAEITIIGLLQLNDFRPNRFTPELIAFYEGIGQSIGVMLARIQAKEVLRQSEEKYRTILAEIADSYFEVDLAGNLTFVNDAACRNLRYSREELLGTNYRDFTAKEDIEHVYQAFNEVYRTGEPNKGFLWKIARKDGSIGFADTSVSLLRSRTGEIIGFRGVGRDITERKMAEEDRKQLELKAQITSRLASVGEMAAGVAHEINNPLTAVTGYAQLLVGREDIPSDIRSDLEAINDGARRVAGIVRTLLAFSRQTKPQRKLVDINELIESTLILRAYHLRVNNIEVVTRLATDVLETVVDPGQIQQVLLNLIVNAEMEMKLAHGKGKLIITTKKSDNTIKICFQDNGPGIKPEVMDKIFDPFFTTREVGEGTGLGLSLCYGIIAEHKGKIYAESKPGKGATFIIELPVVTEVAPPKPAKPDVKKPEKAVKARILVVDDEQVVRDIVNRVLTGEGHKVDAVDNAADALKKIESQKYKLILVDIKMPGMDGVELYKRIQKIDKSLARKVVFITGDVMGADTEKFLSETKVAHIDKPFNAEQLSREVQRALTAGR